LIKQYSKNVDYIIHLAALIGIPYSYSAIESYIDVNIKGTQNLLRASLENQIDYFIHTSTSEVYGTAQYAPIDEKHPLVGQSPYSATKIAADNLVVSFNKSFNQKNLILRPFNTFGPRQSTRAVIPSIILQALNSNKLYLGKINTTRDFTYVDDTVNAFLKAMKSPKAFNGQILNLGIGEDFSIKEVISIVSKYLNKKLIVKEEKLRIRPKKSEVLKLISNNKLAQKKINWKPDYSKRKGFEQGIISTIEWFKKNKGIETSFSKFNY
jgi:nucleoside-diphosphate-sugar epimerase